jgi:hypothetical protein
MTDQNLSACMGVIVEIYGFIKKGFLPIAKIAPVRSWIGKI